MKKPTYHVVACVFLMFLWNSSPAQTKSIGGVVNEYSKVLNIDRTARTVRLADVSMFKPEELPDTVLLVQMTGITDEGFMGNAGRYEFHIVTGVEDFTVSLLSAPGIFDTEELVQMVRVPSYKNADINNTLTCKEWQWIEGTGGILALMVEGTLTFNADIDVSGLGFKGGDASEDVLVECIPPSRPNYPANASDKAGNKGEGAITTSFFNPGISNDSIRGFQPTWNGGGGGHGKWAGGGGGANGDYGGNGDNQACSTSGNMVRGFFEFNCGNPIKYGDIIPSERMYMGGGGGAGTGAGTAGGNGGGIVIIVAQKLQFSPNTYIKANGSSVQDLNITHAGAGGGGAGGSIILSVESYGNIQAEIMGGNGGNVNRGRCDNTENSMGAGGGGSGGIILVSGDMSQYLSGRVKLDGGKHGEINLNSGTPCDMSSDDGIQGKIFYNFKVSLKGFFRNFIITPSDTLVCHNRMVTVMASQPVSSTERDDYYWEILENDDWKDVTATNTNGLTYLRRQFTQNTYVRRIVKSEGIIDTSKHIMIQVRNPVYGNQISPNVTLCWREENYTINGNNSVSGGGGGPFTYEWEESLDNRITWTKINDATGHNLSISLPKNDDIWSPAYRRRVVSFPGCVSDWNTTVITVHPEINNVIAPLDQVVCGNTAVLTMPELTGGNGTQYECLWEISTDNKDWYTISHQPNYQPILHQQSYGEYFYRRLVFSGQCRDTSKVVTVRFKQQPKPSDYIIKTNNVSGDIVGDKALIFLFSASIDVQPPDDGIGKWSSTNDDLRFNPDNQSKTTISNLQFGVDTITWTPHDNVCNEISVSTIIEVKNVIIPSGFSPDGDDINDCFRIVGGENAISSELIIRDRYNKIVFESKSFNQGSSDLTDCTGWWDGLSMSGNELPSGTYFYQLVLKGGNDKIYIYKGNVSLKR